MNNLLSELRRRNVFRVAMVYGVVGWLLAQVAVMLENAFSLPVWFDTLVISLLLIGFPIALIFSWAFELTPEGFQPTDKNVRTSSDADLTRKKKRGLNVVIISGLVVAVAVLLFREVTDTRAPVGASMAQAEAPSDMSIAVLPFEDFSADKDQAYFANGISEELLNVLARIQGLRVSSRTSAFAFKGQGTPIREIAEALNVAHVLEGSIRKSGNTLRITAQLINPKTDVHMWSETYDRPLTADNIFKIQDEIAAAIVTELKGQLKFEAVTEPTARTANLEAYQLYLRARENMRLREGEALRKAETGFKQVIALDPNFAPAYAGLADTYMLLDTYGGLDDAEAIRLATPHVEQALKLGPNSAEALNSASLLATINVDIDKALEFAKRAIAANPNYSTAYIRLGNSYVAKSQHAESLAAYQKGLEIDPLSPILLTNLAYSQLAMGKIEDAKASAEKNILHNPENALAYEMLATIHWQENDLTGAHGYFKDSQAFNPESDSVQTNLGTIYADVGLLDLAIKTARDPAIKADFLARNGQAEAARKTLPENANPMNKLNAQYALRDYEAVIESFKPVAEAMGLPDKLTPDSQNIIVFAYLAFVLNREGHPDFAKYAKVLDTYFAGKTSIDFKELLDLESGVIYSILKDETDASFDWINRMVDLEIAANTLNSPIYDGLRDSSKFSETAKRMEALQSKYRAEIEAQLANPKPNWIVPE
ncbi:tetratricopeptide repeat protein [Litorimonas sp.]|uniref:tetratricopeptide repeat protein n=1 Tax=Litorimonas sp. TaxID=1892381 RepID=UPI003A88430E